MCNKQDEDFQWIIENEQLWAKSNSVENADSTKCQLIYTSFLRFPKSNLSDFLVMYISPETKLQFTEQTFWNTRISVSKLSNYLRSYIKFMNTFSTIFVHICISLFKWKLKIFPLFPRTSSGLEKKLFFFLRKCHSQRLPLKICIRYPEKKNTHTQTQQLLTVARFAIVMTFLTSEFWLVKTFGTFGMTFAAGQLPTGRTLNTLVTSWPTASVTA